MKHIAAKIRIAGLYAVNTITFTIAKASIFSRETVKNHTTEYAKKIVHLVDGKILCGGELT